MDLRTEEARERELEMQQRAIYALMGGGNVAGAVADGASGDTGGASGGGFLSLMSRKNVTVI